MKGRKRAGTAGRPNSAGFRSGQTQTTGNGSRNTPTDSYAAYPEKQIEKKVKVRKKRRIVKDAVKSDAQDVDKTDS